MLRFVGAMNWEESGSGVKEISADNPLAPLYDAITILKQDFDETMREKESLRHQVVHSAKLATMGTLSAGVAHELNNPLAAILGFSDIIEQVSTEARSKELAGKINRAAKRMKGITDQLRRMGRDSQARDWQDVDVNVPVRDSLVLLEGDLRKGVVEVVFELAENLPTVWGNASELQSVIQNLISNAVDAFIGVRDGRKKRIQVSSAAAEGGVLLRCQDNGSGMPAEVRDRIFEPFFTTKELGRGTGLGLSLVHTIIEDHKGTIKVSSEPDRGTTFEIFLPAKRE
jgi:C4-dicarboxylate-specific signal transduction histidine kinase